MGESVRKWKKIRKESRFKKRRNEEIFLQQIRGVLWGGRLIDIRERGRKKGEDSLIVRRVEREVFNGRGRKHGKDQWEKSGNTKTSGDFLTRRKCFQVCLL